MPIGMLISVWNPTLCSIHAFRLFRWGELFVAEEDYTADMALDLSAWVVRYPWSEDADEVGTFNSSNTMLNQVWELCKNTVKVGALGLVLPMHACLVLPLAWA